MDEERLRIQQMVADGKITPEEGDELIESLGRQDSGGAATVESEPGQVSPRKRSGRNVAGVISLCLFLGGLALPVIGIGINIALKVFGVPWGLSIAVFALPALLLEILAAVIGFIGWRSTSGKVGAIGGLVTTALMLLAALVLIRVPVP